LCTVFAFHVIYVDTDKIVFVHQGQKVHLSRPSLSSLTEAQQRLENTQGEKARLGRSACILHFLGDRTNHKAKDIIGKITNLFSIYLFQIDEFINRY
jgi:hypothetical protein